MSEKYKFNNPQGLYFITSTIVHWIDLFTRRNYIHLIIKTLQYYQLKRGLIIHAYCIMPSHLHLIVSSTENLPAIIRDFKKLSNKRIIEEIEQINESRSEWLLNAFRKAALKLKRIHSYKLWQDGNHPIELVDSSMIDQELDYIHQNPVVAEIVDEAETYIYSSAREYAGIKRSLLDLELL